MESYSCLYRTPCLTCIIHQHASAFLMKRKNRLKKIPVWDEVNPKPDTIRLYITVNCKITTRIYRYKQTHLKALQLSAVNNPLKPTVAIWASECPDVKNYQWRLNPVWHRMLYSCTHMATVGFKGFLTDKTVGALAYAASIGECISTWYEIWWYPAYMTDGSANRGRGHAEIRHGGPSPKYETIFFI